MKVAAAYIRVSTDDQIEYSPDSQLEAIKKYAAANNLYLPEQYIFIDEGISGRSVKKRLQFKNMIALAKSNPKPFDVILLWKFSRFARNREDSIVYKSMLRKQCQIDVVSISEAVGDDKMSVLFEAMIEAMDEYYSINLAEEVKRGMTEKAKRGEVLSIAPFGYKIKEKKLVIDEEKAEIIKSVFHDYANGAGCLAIAKKLNSLGIRSNKGNLIENRTVEYWLNNPVYIGKIRWNPNGKTNRNYNDKNLIISDGVHEPIIDDETWCRVQNKLKDNKLKYVRWRRDPDAAIAHWLNGVLRCGICGRTLGYAAGFYVCSGKQKGVCSGCGCISVNVISGIIIDKFDKLLNCDKINLEFADTSAVAKQERDCSLKLISTKLEEAKFRLERVKYAFESGIDTLEEYKAGKEKINEEINNLENLKKEELNKAQSDAAVSLDTVKEYIFKNKLYKLSEFLKLDFISNEVKNKALKSVVKEIIKTGENGRVFRIVFWEPTA